MMNSNNALIETLPIRRRLALTYAPAYAQPQTLVLLALDLRLANIVRHSKEPMLAQLRLSWWREQILSDGGAWPDGEPLFAGLRGWNGFHNDLEPLVNAWDPMSGAAPLDLSVFEGLARARGLGFAALAHVLSVPQFAEEAERCGFEWGLADLASRVSNSHEREMLANLVLAQEWRRARLPRALRALAVLHGLARNEGADGNEAIHPRNFMKMIRIGFLGL